MSIKALFNQDHFFMVQGPLAGISCAPFRVLAQRYGKPAFCYTEMLSCKTLNAKSGSIQKRYIYKDPEEGPLCFQLSGSDPRDLSEAVKRATDYGADAIDLNCGCPVKKIRTRGAGSGLLTQPQKLYQILSAMKNNTHLPVSIKIRLEPEFNHAIGEAIIDADVDFVTIHGRHWTEHYETPCRHADIKFFVEQLKSRNIPVIGNGDVSCVNSLRNMLKTGCAGVMIARAGVGQPWLYQQLKLELAGEKFLPPTASEVGKIFLEHVERLINLLDSENLAILQARNFAKYYARHLSPEIKSEFNLRINRCQNRAMLKEIISYYFK